jgi:hypothetical protein
MRKLTILLIVFRKANQNMRNENELVGKWVKTPHAQHNTSPASVVLNGFPSGGLYLTRTSDDQN